MNYVKYRRWWSTKNFHSTGDHWKENKQYCPFPEGTHSYDEFWDEQEEYIRNGFTVDGQRTSGLHYLYLNFCPIWNKKIKRHKFPDFRSIDAEWFLDIEEVMGLGPHLNNYDRPVGHVTGKTRQSGHSLKGCVPLVYNMNFVPGSKNYLGAYLKGQAQKTNNMYQYYHDHLYRYTDFGKGWLKKDDGEYYKTGYKEEVNGEFKDAGFQSELRILAFSDNSEKGIGGGVDLAVLEECGAFPNLDEAIMFMKNACKDGDLTTGSILAYGAAAKLTSAEPLRKLMYDPLTYEFKGYDNIWDENPPAGQKVGMFIPNYSCRPPYIDEDGNPMEEQAIEAKEKRLAKIKTTDYEGYLQEASQMPNTITEMFAVRQKARFPGEIIDGHLAFLEAHKGELSWFVDLYMDQETFQVKYNFTERQPIWDYPIPKGIDLRGTVEIFEFPEEGARYIASIDSYNQQDANTSSLANILIYKTQGSLLNTGRIIVAEYYGRPDNKDTLYRTFVHLQLLYNNAIALHENEDIEITPWYYNQGYDYLLADQPDIIRNYLPNSTVKRVKGIHAATPLIIAAENKIQKYLTETIGNSYNEKGEVNGIKYGVTRILSLGQMRELKAYVHDPKMNFDRERTLGWLLMYEEEIYTTIKNDDYDQQAADFLTNTNRLGNAEPLLHHS